MIARYFSQGLLDSSAGLIDVGIGDDCAVLSVPAGQRLALSMDTLVAGRHFPHDAMADDIAYRAVAVAASDLAAMGATPLAATLALTLPSADQVWIKSFSQGLGAALRDCQLSLIGGDTTQGPLCISVQVHGLLPNEKSLLRSGAQIGDSIFVSGCLGDAAAALALFSQQLHTDTAGQEYLQQRFYRPQPRLALGQALLSVASSAIDISDGLLADLGHITARSGVAARIYSERLPLSRVLSAHPDRAQAFSWALAGGDDYELCFTVSPRHLSTLESVASQCNISLTAIGTILPASSGRPENGVECIGSDGKPVTIAVSGYQHFTEDQ